MAARRQRTMPEDTRRRAWVSAAWALLAYVATAVVFHWPLPARIGSGFTGPITGDTAIYVWNQWVFRHEIAAHGRFPLFTNEILTLSSPTDLGVHNYTLFANLVAFPLIPVLGVAAAFNTVFLGITALTAWTMFLLARRVTGRTAEAWLAGMLFGFSPVLVARSTAHFSLAAAAPLPVFVLCLMRAHDRCTAVNALLVGASVAWAAMCDVYFGVYCLMIGVIYLGARHIRVIVKRDDQPAIAPRILRTLDVLIAAIAAVTLFILATGGTEVHAGGLTIGLESLYTPVLLLTVLGLARFVIRVHPRFVFYIPPAQRPKITCLAVAAASCTLLLSPQLYAIGARLADGGSLHQRIFWRSSPRGIDLLALFMPNPNHKLFGQPWRDWLTLQDGAYVENAAALTLVALGVVTIAVLRYRFRPPRVWLVLTACFAALALGPFVHIAGFNTHIPGPWALLRYVPLLSAARTPARFSIVLMMAFSVVFALALTHIGQCRPRRRGALLVGVAALLAFELAPLPRRVQAATVPDVYRVIAADPRDVQVLEIPFGFSDGERSEGGFNASAQFYQTVHQKPIVSGGLSRIGDRALMRQHRSPVIRALVRLSEGLSVSDSELELARRYAPLFVQRTRLGYVVIDSTRTSPALRRFVTEVFGLVKMGEGGGRELYEPTIGTAGPGRNPSSIDHAAPAQPPDAPLDIDAGRQVGSNRP